MSRLATLRTLFILSTLTAAPASAQPFAERSPAGRDSLTAEVAYIAMLAQLTGRLARGLYDTAPAPWTLQFPDDSSRIGWHDIRRALTTLLRARPRTDADSTRSHLHVFDVRYTNDSLIVSFDAGAYRRCPNGTAWQGSHTTYRLAVAWARLTWPYRAEAVQLREMAPCRTRRFE